MKCKTCDAEFFEDDTNPNIHYSTPVGECWRCRLYKTMQSGSWYQDKNGEYKQKE